MAVGRGKQEAAVSKQQAGGRGLEVMRLTARWWLGDAREGGDTRGTRRHANIDANQNLRALGQLGLISGLMSRLISGLIGGLISRSLAAHLQPCISISLAYHQQIIRLRAVN